MTYGVVYQAFDTTNGKSYVGQTTQLLETRRKQHEHPGGNSWKFKRALQKRRSAFVWTVLTRCGNQSDLDFAEDYWIEFFDCVGEGYNLRGPGGGGRGKMSLESRAKMSQSKIGNSNGKGFRHTVEHRQFLSEKMKEFYAGRDPFSSESRLKAKLAKAANPRKHSDETRKKMSESQRLRRQRERSS